MEKNRPLTIFKYLWDHTDEDHPAIITEILAYLEASGFHATRKTVAADLLQLQESGFDVVCTKSRQNRYFIGTRTLEIAELKAIVDAVQAAKFLSADKSTQLIEKLAALGSPYQAEQLKRNLYVSGKAKTHNEAVYYTVDLLHTAINNNFPVTFQYLQYTPDKQCIEKHSGAQYVLSPYDMVWDTDRYYVVGWSERHEKIAKFRVDRIVHPQQAHTTFHPKPEGYSVEALCRKLFMMYDGQMETATLRCSNALMDAIIDRFGEDVSVIQRDENTFTVAVEVAQSPTFFAWVFTYSGEMEILAPESMRQAYRKRLRAAQQLPF